MGSGQSAANVMTGATGQAASNIGQMQLGAGQARASGYIGQANALAGALGQIGGFATDYPMYQAQIGAWNRSNRGVGPDASLLPSVNNAMASNAGIF
jgi:hypothetical protein